MRIYIILKHICITTVAAQKHEVLHILSVCVYSLRYPVRKVRAPYYIVICGWYGYTVFFHTISETARFSEQKLSNIMCACVLILAATFVWNISHSKKNSKKCYHRCAYIFTQSTRYSCDVSIKPECSQQIFKKYSHANFHENLSSESQVVPCGHTDGQTWQS